ncbi:MAG: site-specific DNA-methyltransferase [Candidatus Eisenbacteria bacterium]|nr:site-specific DNA-methyltransferase [Candidatus Eisenbacteria bacterium]
MAKKRSSRTKSAAKAGTEPSPTADYRHKQEKRKNNPPAKIAAEGVVPVIPKAKYAYSPHRPPTLRLDPTADADTLPELLAAAKTRKLTDDEAATLAAALRVHEPWLEWADKQEQHRRGYFEVDPVALNIHERVSAQAILKIAARQDVERSLFADPEQEYHEAVQFYKHDIDWTNRLILGDSLQVMSSLARRENLTGKVQMIFMDPPYGINYKSNFQPIIGDVDVKNRDEHLTRELEMVHAFRDTWHLGVHSYLSYLRERLLVARDLLADTGSLFLQIGDDRSHLVRSVMDEVFAPSNFVAEIVYVKTTGSTSNDLSRVYDTLLWYRKSAAMKFRPLFHRKVAGEAGATGYTTVLLANGERRPVGQLSDDDDETLLPDGAVLIASDNYTSQSPGSRYNVWLEGRTYRSEPGYWKTDSGGMRRVLQCERMLPGKTYPGYCRRITDFECFPITNVWTDTLGQNQFGGKKIYATQTALKVLQRCICLTTDPGDLVLDPTSGSGTTAVVAERMGRRWIGIDSSRVAIATARHRLIVQKYPYFMLTDPERDVAGGFEYNKLPHIQPSDIAQNRAIDPILAEYGPLLDRKLADLKAAIQLEIEAHESRSTTGHGDSAHGGTQRCQSRSLVRTRSPCRWRSTTTDATPH